MAIKLAVMVPSGSNLKTGFSLSLIELFRWCIHFPMGYDPDDKSLPPLKDIFEGFNDDNTFRFKEPWQQIQIGLLNFQSSILPNSRTKLVQGALDMGADYGLFLDSDMTFPADLFHRLAKHDKDIVSCMYAKRDGKEPVIQYLNCDFNGCQEVNKIATGCVLFKMDVWKKIEKPWFEFHMARPGDPYEVIGEDIYMSNKFNAARVPMYCDFDLSKDIGHIGELTYKLNFKDMGKLTAPVPEKNL